MTICLEVLGQFQLYDGSNYLPIFKIEIGEKVNQCTEDLTIRFNFKNKQVTGFMNESGIIKLYSKYIKCSSQITILEFETFYAKRNLQIQGAKMWFNVVIAIKNNTTIKKVSSESNLVDGINKDVSLKNRNDINLNTESLVASKDSYNRTLKSILLGSHQKQTLRQIFIEFFDVNFELKLLFL